MTRTTRCPSGRLAFVVLLLLVCPLGSRAEGSASSEVYEIRWPREMAILAIAAGSSASSHFVNGIGRSPCPCDRSGINALDRSTAGRDSKAADHASDIVAAGLLAGPFALDALDLRGRAGAREGFRSDAVVILESIALDAGLNQLVKAVTHRPRPLLYGLPSGDPAYRETDNYRSFYSQHTSTAFAAGISYARTFALRHPTSSSRWMVYGAAIVGGATVGALRVAAGQHFPTDVITSAVSGSAAGWLIPELHRRTSLDSFYFVPLRDGGALSVSIPLR